MLLKETWGNYLEESFSKNLNRIAVVDISKNARYTYRDLKIQVRAFEKAFMGYGITRGTHVALVFPSSATWIANFLALTSIGAVAVCLNNDLADGEIRNHIMDSDSRVVITDEETYVKIRLHEREMDLKQIIIVDRRGYCSEELHCGLDTFLKNGEFVTDEMVEEAHNNVHYDDILSMQYTSGTTGMPKAVMAAHYKVLNNVTVLQDLLQYTNQDKILTSLPMYHVAGCYCSCLLSFCVGASIVLMSRFNTKRAIQALAEEECTAFHGVPTMFKLVLNKLENEEFPSLRQGVVLGAHCEPSTIEEIRNKLGIKYMLSQYGQSEGCTYTQIRLGDPVEKMLHSVGRPIEGVMVKIVNQEREEVPCNVEGEIIIKTEYLMEGYYNNEEVTAKTVIDGWMYTGDLGKVDEEGYVYITGRKKDIIIRGGENISPIDIEAILRKCDVIKDIVILGVPDEIMGQEIGACIILNEDVKGVDEATLIEKIGEFANKNLAKYKRPKYIRFVNAFPMTGSGKIQKTKLARIAFS